MYGHLFLVWNTRQFLVLEQIPYNWLFKSINHLLFFSVFIFLTWSRPKTSSTTYEVLIIVISGNILGIVVCIISEAKERRRISRFLGIYKHPASRIVIIVPSVITINIFVTYTTLSLPLLFLLSQNTNYCDMLFLPPIS
jgi:hypothetical protein